MKKNFKRWLALLLAVVVVAATCIYAPDHFLHAADKETTNAADEREPELKEQELVLEDETEPAQDKTITGDEGSSGSLENTEDTVLGEEEGNTDVFESEVKEDAENPEAPKNDESVPVGTEEGAEEAQNGVSENIIDDKKDITDQESDENKSEGSNIEEAELPVVDLVKNTETGSVGHFEDNDIKGLSEEESISEEEQKVTGFAVNAQQRILLVGDQTKVTAVVLPEFPDSQGVTWVSSDPAVASVTEDGDVTGIGEGTVVIRGTSKDDPRFSSGVSIVVRKAGVEAVEIEGNNEAYYFVGDTINLNSKITYEKPDAEYNADYKVEWASSNPNVASVDESGAVTIKSAGNTVIRASVGDALDETEIQVYATEPKTVDIAIWVTNQDQNLKMQVNVPTDGTEVDLLKYIPKYYTGNNGTNYVFTGAVRYIEKNVGNSWDDLQKQPSVQGLKISTKRVSKLWKEVLQYKNPSGSWKDVDGKIVAFYSLVQNSNTDANINITVGDWPYTEDDINNNSNIQKKKTIRVLVVDENNTIIHQSGLMCYYDQAEADRGGINFVCDELRYEITSADLYQVDSADTESIENGRLIDTFAPIPENGINAPFRDTDGTKEQHYIIAAHLQSKKFMVSYDANGGEGDVPETQAYTATGTEVNVASGQGLEKTGYVFGGWKDKATGRMYYENNTFMMPAQHVELEAVWLPVGQLIRYTVNDSNKGTITSDSDIFSEGSLDFVIVGSTASAKEGYKFVGWYEGETLLSAEAKFVPQGEQIKTTVYTACFENDKEPTPKWDMTVEKKVVSMPEYHNSAYIVGEEIKYEVTIKNTGNVDLKDVAVADRMWAWGVNGSNSTLSATAELAEGESDLFDLKENETKYLHYTYTVQPEDVGKRIFNVVNVFNDLINVEDESETVDIIQAAPKLSLEKTILNPPADGSMYKPGDVIRYQIQITNEGNIILKDVVIEDTMTGASGKITATSATGIKTWKSEAADDGYTYIFTVKDDIDIGEKAVITYEYTVRKEDEGKTIGNMAVAKDIPSENDPMNPAPVEIEKKELTVKKEVTNPLPEGGSYNTGDSVEFLITIANTGNVVLNDITVTDTMIGTAGNLQAVLREGEREKIEVLEPEEKVELHYTYTVQEADMRGSGIKNTVHVRAADGTEGADETDYLPLTGQQPLYTVSKQIVSKGNAEGKYEVGQTIQYQIDVANTGNVNLPPMTVKDIMVGASGTISNISGAAWNEKTAQFITESGIAVGETVTITYDYVVQEEDAGKTILNTAGPTLNASTAEAEVKNKELTVKKLVTSTPKLSGGYVMGEKITFDVVVTNTGTAALSDVVVEDQMQNAAGQAVLAKDESATIESLGVGESVTLHYTYTVQKEDIGKTDIFNTVTAKNDAITSNDKTEIISMDRLYNLIIHYVYEDGTTAAETVADQLAYGEWFAPVISPDIAGYTPDLAAVECDEKGITADIETTVVYRVTSVPQLSLTKTVSEPDSHVYKLGEMINYTITAKNTGNVTLENIVVEDVLTGNSGNSACVIDALAPGASMDIPVTYTVADADVKAGGELLNVATATGEAHISSQGDKVEEVTARAEKKVSVETQGASLTIHKTADKVSGVKPGDVINYMITVTNSGSVTLTKVDITDELTNDGWIITGKGLSPGESQEYITSYTVTEADILHGSVVNLAEAAGIDPDGNEITPLTPGRAVTYTEPINTNYTITKCILNPRSEYIVDDSDTPIRYEITVASQANVTLHNVVVKDQLEGASGRVTFTELGKGTVNADNSVTISALAPGETVTLHCEYTISRADAGKHIVNTAIATADPIVPTDPEHPTPVTPEEKRSSAAPAAAENIYTLTIHYRYASGREAAPDVAAQYLEGESFFHRSPSISGYKPNHAFIRSGNLGMPATDVEVTVTYRANTSGSSSSAAASADPTPTPGAAPGVTPDNTGLTGGGTAAPAAGTAPAAEDSVAIPDDTVPMGGMVQLDEDGNVDIVPVEDEKVPLSAREFSKHMCCVLHLILMLAGMIIVVYYTSRRKRCQARIFALTEELREEQYKRR